MLIKIQIPGLPHRNSDSLGLSWTWELALNESPASVPGEKQSFRWTQERLLWVRVIRKARAGTWARACRMYAIWVGKEEGKGMNLLSLRVIGRNISIQIPHHDDDLQNTLS